MPNHAEVFAESVVTEFRQALADTQFALAKANATGKVKDLIIAELQAQLEAMPAPPKPGPPSP